MNDVIQFFLKLAIFTLFVFSCAKKPAEEVPVTAPTEPEPSVPYVPPPPHPARLQFNSGSRSGTTTNAYKTTLSLGNHSAKQSGITANGYRVQYNVQNPNSPR